MNALAYFFVALVAILAVFLLAAASEKLLLWFIFSPLPVELSDEDFVPSEKKAGAQ